MPNTKLALYMDNHASHITLLTREYLQSEDILPIHAPAYQVLANPALTVLKIVNEHFKAYCSSGGLKEKNIAEVIDASVNQISLQQVTFCIRESRDYIDTMGGLLLNYKNPFAETKIF